MKATPFVSLLILTACASGGSIMTISSFYDIPVGATQEEVMETAGKPYAIHKKSDGSVEYEYIERFQAGSRNINERHYYLLIKDGKVVAKRVKQESPPPYTFDSYEMQTTENDSDSNADTSP